MKPIFSQRRNAQGAGAIEVFAVIMMVVLLVGYMLPSLARKGVRVKRTVCQNNLKQIGIGFGFFAGDHGGKFPMQISTNEGGSKEFTNNVFEAWRHFAAASNQIANPKVLLFPNDLEKTNGPVDFPGFTNSLFLSYFIRGSASAEFTLSILLGDANLDVNGSRLPKAAESPVDAKYAWGQRHGAGSGNLLLSDSSMWVVRNQEMHKYVQRQFQKPRVP